MKFKGLVVLFLLFSAFLFAQEVTGEEVTGEEVVAGEAVEAEVPADAAVDSEVPPEEVVEQATENEAESVVVEEPEEEQIFRTFEGEKALKNVKVYENRIYKDGAHGVFGNFFATPAIASEIKKGLGKTITNESVLALMEEWRARDDFESVDYYFTFDEKDRATLHVTLIDNPGFQEFEGTVTFNRISFYCRNNFFVNRSLLNETLALEKKKEYTQAEVEEAVERIYKLYVFNDISWGIRETKTDKNGNKFYAFQMILSEYPGDKIPEGEQITVSKIQFLGNWYTKDWVMLREIDIKEGDVVGVPEIEYARQRIHNLGMFRAVDWGVVYDEEGNAILVFNVKDNLTIQPSFAFAVGSDRLHLGIGVWDTNFLGTSSYLWTIFTLKDLMPTFEFSLRIPKLNNSNFELRTSLNYSSENKYTDYQRIEEEGGASYDLRHKGYRENTVTAAFGGLYLLQLDDKNERLWEQRFGLMFNYQYIFSKEEEFLGMPRDFAVNFLKLSEDFQYDTERIGEGHYASFDFSYTFNNLKKIDYRKTGISFSAVNTVGFPFGLTGYMSDGITEKAFNTFDTWFRYFYIPVSWFEFRGQLATGYTTTQILSQQYYFGSRSLVRNMPTNRQGSGKAYYKGNFDIAFTPPIPYVNKVLQLEISLFGDIANYGNDYNQIWRETPLWSAGFGIMIYIPFFGGTFGLETAWGPSNVEGKNGTPYVSFALTKFYNYTDD